MYIASCIYVIYILMKAKKSHLHTKKENKPFYLHNHRKASRYITPVIGCGIFNL